MIEGVLRPLILGAAQSRWLREFANGHGIRFGATKFVAGTSLDDFVTRCRVENAAGRRVAAGYLGEGVRSAESASRVTADFLTILDRISVERLDSTLAVKLTHLGLGVGLEVAEQNLVAIAERAARYGNFVRVDMEEARYVDLTLEIYRALRSRGLSNIGIVLQSYLKRSRNDLETLLPLKPNIRVVKGAYLEDSSIAFASREKISDSFLEIASLALGEGCFVAAATHDDRLIDDFSSFAARKEIEPEGRFEFQMLLGVRTPLQEQLTRSGQPLRVSVPFGSDWYPYLMRRMAENPANLALVLRNLW